jgi:UDP-N-acetylglucosamine 2-epimerase
MSYSWLVGYGEQYTLVLMPDTAWIELIDEGWNILVDADKEKIIQEGLSKITTPGKIAEFIYGNGQAGEKIAMTLLMHA